MTPAQRAAKRSRCPYKHRGARCRKRKGHVGKCCFLILQYVHPAEKRTPWKPTPGPVIRSEAPYLPHDSPWCDLTVRSYNALTKRIDPASHRFDVAIEHDLREVLSISPNTISNFGIRSFLEVVTVLVRKCGVPIEDLYASEFWRSAPNGWRPTSTIAILGTVTPEPAGS